MKTQKKHISQRFTSLFITMSLVIVHVFLAAYHESWRDEGQAWMIVQNATLPELFSDLCIEGHPALWFVTIMPLVKLGLPFRYFYLVSLLFTALGLYLLLENAPFPYWCRLIFCFSSLFCYYNAIIPRIYSEAVFLVLLTATAYSSRERHPWLYGGLIFLLTQTHLLLEGVAAALILECLVRLLHKGSEKRSATIPFIIGSIGGLLTVAELFPREGTNRSVDISSSGILNSINAKRFILYSNVSCHSLWGIPSNLFVALAGFIAVGLLWLVFWIVKNKEYNTLGLHFLMAFIAFAIPVPILCFIYAAHTQMSSCILLIMIFLFWITWRQDRSKEIRYGTIVLVTMLSLLTMFNVIKDARNDVIGLYSNSKSMAEYIIENANHNAVVIVENTEYNSPVYCYVAGERPDITFYNVIKDEVYRYHIWGERLPEVSISEALAAARTLFVGRDVYWLRSWALDDESYVQVVRIDNAENISNEYYILYKVGV